METKSSILAWRIPWTEEPGGLQSTASRESDMTERLNLPSLLTIILSDLLLVVPLYLFLQFPFSPPALVYFQQSQHGSSWADCPPRTTGGMFLASEEAGRCPPFPTTLRCGCREQKSGFLPLKPSLHSNHLCRTRLRSHPLLSSASGESDLTHFPGSPTK